jgi:hypothetical protein
METRKAFSLGKLPQKNIFIRKKDELPEENPDADKVNLFRL